MIYLLDTSACVLCMNVRSIAYVRRFQSLKPIDVAVCSVVRAELAYGAMKSQNPPRTLAVQQAFLAPFLSLPFDDAAASIYGQIRAGLERIGQTIGGNDLMIAAIALAHNLILVTHNTREFQRVPNLHIEDWET